MYLTFLFILWRMGIPLVVGWIIPVLLLVIQHSYADSIAVFALGARTVSEGEAPELHAIIERLAAQANVPKPRLALIHANEFDAFTIGRAGHPRMVTVTTGLLCRCTRQELERVLVQELRHPTSFRMGVVVVGMISTIFAAAVVMAFL